MMRMVIKLTFNHGIEKKKVESLKLLNNRSFSTLAEVIVWLILGKKLSIGLTALLYGTGIALLFSMPFWAPILMIGVTLTTAQYFREKMAVMFIKPFVDVILWLTFGRMDAASTYLSLPEEVVDHIVAVGDGIILKQTGLHNNAVLKGRRFVKKSQLKVLIEQKKAAGQEALEIPEYKTLLNMKDSKLCLYPVEQQDFEEDVGMIVHNTPLLNLSTYHALRGADSMPPQINGEKVMEQKMVRLLG